MDPDDNLVKGKHVEEMFFLVERLRTRTEKGGALSESES